MKRALFIFVFILGGISDSSFAQNPSCITNVLKVLRDAEPVNEEVENEAHKWIGLLVNEKDKVLFYRSANGYLQASDLDTKFINASDSIICNFMQNNKCSSKAYYLIDVYCSENDTLLNDTLLIIIRRDEFLYIGECERFGDVETLFFLTPLSQPGYFRIEKYKSYAY